MTWTLLDDNYFDHDEWERISHTALVLHLAGLGYCNRLLTDGVLPRRKAARLAPVQPDQFDGALAELLAEGIWAERNGDTLEIVGFLTGHQQKSRADVLADRERQNARKQAWRAKRNAGPPGGGGNTSPPATNNNGPEKTATETDDHGGGFFDDPGGCVVVD